MRREASRPWGSAGDPQFDALAALERASAPMPAPPDQFQRRDRHQARRSAPEDREHPSLMESSPSQKMLTRADHRAPPLTLLVTVTSTTTRRLGVTRQTMDLLRDVRDHQQRITEEDALKSSAVGGHTGGGIGGRGSLLVGRRGSATLGGSRSQTAVGPRRLPRPMRAGERKGEIVCVQAQADGGIGGEQLTLGAGGSGGGGDVVDVVTAEALSRGLGRVVAADVLGSSDDVWAPERLRLLLEARKGELLKDLHRREAEEKAQRRGSLGIHNEVAASAFRRARSCWSVRHHWVEFDWREKVLVGLVLVLFACQAVLALLLLIFGSHVPECASAAGAVDGVVGRKTALLGPLLVIVAYFQLQAAMHGILDDNVSEMVALPTINFALSLIYILTFPSQAANDEGESFGLSAKLGSGNGEETYWYFVYVFCRATGVDPARCAAQTFAESWTVGCANGTESGDGRGGSDAAGGLYVSLYLVVILAALISSILLTAAAVQCRRHFGWRSYKLVAPGGYERPREMYEALNATLTSVRGSFLLVVLQLLGYAAFHAHVLCAPLQVLFWVAFLLHIALALDPLL